MTRLLVIDNNRFKKNSVHAVKNRIFAETNSYRISARHRPLAGQSIFLTYIYKLFNPSCLSTDDRQSSLL